LRAESLSEVPVIGRMIAASERRAHAGADSPDAFSESGATLLRLETPHPGDGDHPDDSETAPPPLAPRTSKRA
jgi:hypothetical protein